MLQYGTLIVPIPEPAADGSCPIMYLECPPGDQQCVRTGAHPGPDAGAGHYNRPGFSWTIQEAAESAERIRHSRSGS